MGLAVTATPRPDHDGNLGPLDLDVGFLRPRGIGLEIDAGVVTGGGYLHHDADKGEYAGTVELSVAGGLSLNAVGIITTKAPDGSGGWSLLIIVSTEFATAIQLGFGLRLKGVGGLIGLNRGMSLAALTDGVRSGALQSVMFPRDIVANAPKIINDIRAFFPARPGTFLIGPMAKLEWGTPPLLRLSLAVVIEIPGNVAVLGVLRAALPPSDDPEAKHLIEINVVFVGALEFDRQRLWLFAALFDSHVVGIPVEGELGVVVDWGAGGDVIATVGGFHPAYAIPALPFPTPKRLSLKLLDSSHARVHAEGYLAITPNTVQFGARVDAYLGFSKFSVEGMLSIDALIQDPPFRFRAEFAVSMAVKAFGVGLFAVRVKGTIEGPRPWHIVGRGGISLLFWDLDVDFEKTWGEPYGYALPGVEILTLVLAELAQPHAWRAVPAPGTLGLVKVREAGPGEVLLEPTGGLRVSQRVVPLGLTLDRFGTSRPADVTSVSVTAAGLAVSDAREGFALAQFKDLSDDERLSLPAFTSERSGVEVSGVDLRTGGMVRRAVRYEEVIIDSNFRRSTRPVRPYPVALFTHLLAGAAVTRVEPWPRTRRRSP
jgi:hypothetical protein